MLKGLSFVFARGPVPGPLRVGQPLLRGAWRLLRPATVTGTSRPREICLSLKIGLKTGVTRALKQSF
jgi:hypothetical protein